MIDGFEALRERMVRQQLIPRGINDTKVLAAFGKVPRHEFVPENYRRSAYEDYPLPIGDSQTISQPYMVALMTQELGLNGGEKVLEIGTGSGYQMAILAEIAGEVYSVERISELAESARRSLERLGYRNFAIKTGDGTLGWSEHAPYNGIIVTAGAPSVPKGLVDQLAEGGRLVIPLGGEFGQMLTVIEKRSPKLISRDVCACVFVPLIGKDGWSL